ncbi:MAG: hypothetical protein ACO3NW_10695, partial [Kiritimatiellia bacterium]
AAALGAKQLAARGNMPFAFRITLSRKQASYYKAAASSRTPQKAKNSFSETALILSALSRGPWLISSAAFAGNVMFQFIRTLP